MKYLAAAVAFWSALASATTVTRDYTDQWYNPNEPGWGANITQQGDVLFVTIFVYGLGSVPVWYVAPSVPLAVVATQTFSGAMYQTAGPYFGDPAFNPGAVTVNPVGTFTFAADSPSTAAINYSVSGVKVAKSVVRQTWRTESLAGSYLGGTIGALSGCSSGNGPYESAASYTVTQIGSNISITEFGQGYACGYSGTYSQAGRMGAATGTSTCIPKGSTQSFTATDIQVSPDALSVRLQTEFGACRFTGRIGGIRRN